MWDIIIAVCLVFAVCAPVWAIARYLRVDLPKFVLPMIAGISLLSFNAYMRYSWSDRTVEALPGEVTVLKEYRFSNIMEPWTYLVPRVSHFIAADSTQTRTNEEHPEIIMGATVMLQEHQPTLNMTVMVNCKEEMVSVVPTKQIAQGQNPMEVAQWASKQEFPYMVDFYCQQ